MLDRPDDWDVLIAHYLGVDHAGHKFGPRHPEMSRKLGEADRAVRRVARSLPRNCLLLVAGDHGMTGSGDHGGDSQDEVMSTVHRYYSMLSTVVMLGSIFFIGDCCSGGFLKKVSL